MSGGKTIINVYYYPQKLLEKQFIASSFYKKFYIYISLFYLFYIFL